MPDPKASIILSAVDKTAAAFKSVDSRMKGIEKASRFVTRGLAGVVAALGVRALSQASDQYRILSNRLKLVTDSAGELSVIQDRLLDLAQDTRSSYEGTVELFARVARSSDQLGISQDRLLRVTESVNQAIQISGATSQEASAGVIQFAQGLASGALRGDELRSVLEQMPRLAQAIADGMGVTIGQLRELGSQGELSAQTVIAAIESQSGALRSEFGETEGTVGQAITGIGNSFLRLVGKVDEATGASNLLVRGLNAISSAVDDITTKDSGELFEDLLDVQYRLVRVNRQLQFERGSTLAQLQRQFPELVEEQERIIALMQERKRIEESLGQEGDPVDGGQRLEQHKAETQQIIANFLAESDAIKAADLAQLEERQAAHSAFIDTLLDEFDAVHAAEQERIAARNQAEADFEPLRQSLLTREQIEMEALQRRLEIVRAAREQELIDQQRFEEISIDLARRSADELLRISREQIAARSDVLLGTAEAAAGALTAFTGAFAGQSKKMFELHKKAAIAEATVSTLAGITKALEFYPPPLSFAMAAAQAAAGFAQVRKIQSQSFGGGGSAGFAGGSGSSASFSSSQQQAPLQPQRDEGRRQIIVNVTQIVEGSQIGTGGEQQLGEDITGLIRTHLRETDDELIPLDSSQGLRLTVGR